MDSSLHTLEERVAEWKRIADESELLHKRWKGCMESCMRQANAKDYDGNPAFDDVPSPEELYERLYGEPYSHRSSSVNTSRNSSTPSTRTSTYEPSAFMKAEYERIAKKYGHDQH